MTVVQMAFEMGDRRVDQLADLDMKRAGRRLEAERKRIARFNARRLAPTCRCSRPMPDGDSCAKCGRSTS